MRFFVALFFAAVVFGQTGSQSGTISGSITNAAHAPVRGMKVEAKNVASGVYYKAFSSAKGEYAFDQLPVGNYEVSVLQLGTKPFIRKDVSVTAGGTQKIDVQVEENPTYATLGELGAYVQLSMKRPPPPQGPAPKMADGKPDFSGTWVTPALAVLPLLFSPQVDLLPWAEDVVRQRILNDGRDVPSSRCLPSSEMITDLIPFKYVQTRNLLVKLTTDTLSSHQVFLDGRAHPSDLEPTWRGHSIGKWDGDALVIDTVGFTDRSWLFFLVPHTDKLHEILRLRRPDLGHLEMEFTYDDPGAFKTPAKFKLVSVLAPDEDVDETVCENNQYTEHVSGK
jgi:Carboxypeptidase regulatory-like domain